MPLSKTIADLQKHYPARLTVDINDLKPYLEGAELEYLAEQVLGEAFYAELLAASAGTPTSIQQDCIDHCNRAVVNLAMHQAIPVLNVTLHSKGLGVVNTQDVVPASKARTDALLQSLLRAGYRGLDRLFTFLVANKASFGTWTTNNPVYDRLVSGLIRDTRTFDELVRIGNSGWLFWRMKPAMMAVELGPVKKTLCSDTLYTDLVTKLTAGSLSASEKKVLAAAQKAIAHLTMARSITELSLTLDNQGAWAFTSISGQETGGGPIPVDARRLDTLQGQYAQQGADALQELRELCQALAEAGTLAAYAASTCYVDPNAAPTPDTPTTDQGLVPLL